MVAEVVVIAVVDQEVVVVAVVGEQVGIAGAVSDLALEVCGTYHPDNLAELEVDSERRWRREKLSEGLVQKVQGILKQAILAGRESGLRDLDMNTRLYSLVGSMSLMMTRQQGVGMSVVSILLGLQARGRPNS